VTTPTSDRPADAPVNDRHSPFRIVGKITLVLLGLALVSVGFYGALLGAVNLYFSQWGRQGHVPWQAMAAVLLIGLLITWLGVWLLRRLRR
jgi:uncharacterized membrane protein YfcA